MVSVGDGRMPTVLAVHMVRVMSAAGVPGSALRGIPPAHIQPMLLTPLSLLVIEMPIVKVVDVVTVHDRNVSTFRTVTVACLGSVAFHPGLPS